MKLAAQKRFKEKDAATRERVGAYDFPVGERRRCGRFLIEKRMLGSAEVAFSRGGGTVLSISKVEPKE